MTQIQTICPNCIVLMDKQGVHSTEVGILDPGYEKSASELKPKLLRCKQLLTWQYLILGL